MPILVGTHNCDKIATTYSSLSNGWYALDTDDGVISGTIYKYRFPDGEDVELRGVRLHLLQSRQNNGYCIWVEDDYWGDRIEPYPPAAAPFSQDIVMGYALNVRVWDVGTQQWMDCAGLVLEFNIIDNVGNTSRMLWCGGEGCTLSPSGIYYVPWGATDPVWAIVTTTVAGNAGTARHVWPREERLIFPRGDGAPTRRYASGVKDFRDPSPQTAAASVTSFATTGVSAWFRGNKYPISLTGAESIIRWGWSSITVIGGAPGGKAYLGSPTEAQLTEHQTGDEEEDWDEEYQAVATFDADGKALFENLPPGEYMVVAKAKFGGVDMAGIGTTTISGQQDATMSLTWHTHRTSEAGKGRNGDNVIVQWGWWRKGWGNDDGWGGATVYMECFWEEYDEESGDWEPRDGWWWWETGTAGDGLGPIVVNGAGGGDPGTRNTSYGPCFLNDTNFGWALATAHESGLAVFGGAHLVCGEGGVFKGFGGGGGGECNDTFMDVGAPICGLYVRPDPNQSPAPNIPGGYNHIEMVPGLNNGRLTTRRAVPAIGWEEELHDNLQDTTEIRWQVCNSHGVLSSGYLPKWDAQEPEPDENTFNWRTNDLTTPTLGARMKGAVMAQPMDEIAAAETCRAADLGMEYGRLSRKPILVTALRQGPEILKGEGYLDGVSGLTNCQCPYCGNATYRDPEHGVALRWRCPHCAGYGVLMDGETFFTTYPMGIAEGGTGEGEIRSWVVRLIEPRPDKLGADVREYKCWYRPECLWEDNIHYVADLSRYGFGLPRVAHHIGFIPAAYWDGMSAWTHDGGYDSGKSCPDWALYEGQADRIIGSVRPKCEVIEQFSQPTEIRIECKRADESECYFYVSLTGNEPGVDNPAIQQNGIRRFDYILPSIGLPESSRRRLASLYAADGQNSPWTAADVIVECHDVRARNPETGTWDATAPWLSSGGVRIDTDGPSIRAGAVYTRVPHWTHWLSHLVPIGEYRTDIDCDWGSGRLNRVAVNSSGMLVAQFLAWPFEDNEWRDTETGTVGEETILDSNTGCDSPNVRCRGDGTSVVVHERAGSVRRAISYDGLQSIEHY